MTSSHVNYFRTAACSCRCYIFPVEDFFSTMSDSEGTEASVTPVEMSQSTTTSSAWSRKRARIEQAARMRSRSKKCSTQSTTDPGPSSHSTTLSSALSLRSYPAYSSALSLLSYPSYHLLFFSTSSFFCPPYYPNHTASSDWPSRNFYLTGVAKKSCLVA